MKPLLLVLATIYLTVTGFGLELVKCGSVVISEEMRTNEAQRRYIVINSKPDGTVLFQFPNARPPQKIVVKPHFFSAIISDNGVNSIDYKTNDFSTKLEQGVEVVTYKVIQTVSQLRSRAEVVFATVSESGYLDWVTRYSQRSVFEIADSGGKSVTNLLSTEILEKGDFLIKYKTDKSKIEEIRIGDANGGSMPLSSMSSYPNPELSFRNRVVLPKLNGDSIDFYLVTDPDLFPDAALGSPKVEGGSATFNVTTSTEEPVAIQSSNDLKVWKRIQSLENANGRSVTVPVGSDKEFLRLVEP